MTPPLTQSTARLTAFTIARADDDPCEITQTPSTPRSAAPPIVSGIEVVGDALEQHRRDDLAGFLGLRGRVQHREHEPGRGLQRALDRS